MNRVRAALAVISVFLISGSSFAQRYENGLIEKSAAVVGSDVIMVSDLEQEAQMMRARGLAVDDEARCELFEQFLTAKLFLTQARLDSLVVNDANVAAALDQRVSEVVNTLGGEEQTEEYFGKPMHKLREEWETALREQTLIQQMQQTVMENTPKLTPKDVEKYYKETPEEDLPIINTKYRLRQICVYPDKKAAELEVREKLIDIRERVLNGEKFSTLARLYSQDPGSVSRGGELGMASRSIFWPAFSDAAMSLKEGQVSQVVETPDGFHIIQLIERKADMFNARHILIKPRYTSADREKAFSKLDSLRSQILDDSVKFETIARYYSEDKRSATSGGLMSDQYTGSSYFEKDQLKPADYNILRNMKEGDISEPFESLDDEGNKGNTVYKILYLDRIIPSHPATFKDDYNDLIDEVQKKNSMEAIEKFIVEKQKTTYIVIDPLFHGCKFQHEGWLK